MSSLFVRPIAILGVVVVLFAGCGDDDGGERITATTTAAVTSTTGSPSLTLTLEGLVGFQGKLVVGSLFPAEGGGDGPVGSVCIQVDTDPWTGSGVFSTSDLGNPCGKDSPYGEVITEAGEYSLNIGVYTPGERAPAVCFNAVATLFGPSEVIIPAINMVPNCTG